MINDKYELFGTNTILTITDDNRTHWVITISSGNNRELDVLMKKSDLKDGVSAGSLTKI